jgi:hypothetical protein
LLAIANEDLLPIADLRTINNTPIGQSNVVNIISTTTNMTIPNINPSETSAKQDGIINIISSPISIPKNTTSEKDTSQVGMSEVYPREISIKDTRFSQIGISQISISQNGMIQTSPIQTGTKQIGISQVGSGQVGITQISSPQTDPSQISSFKSIHSCIDSISFRNWNQFNPIENTFSSTVTSQQFISSNLPNHINTSELTNVESTAVTIWNNLVNPAAPINLTFEITNLPTGQLAEATINGYDKLGRPNTATISIDDDANGIGWYIDQTPGDNSEFSSQLTNTAYQAVTGEAVGKYDLLTAILHEMGHTLGIINGYSQFDKYIKGNNSPTLTPDGSHLDSTLYPYDLMNTSLKPGIRKLPSALDLAILNAIWSNTSPTSQQLSTTANLTAGALIGITNGNFDNSTTWETLGATNILNGSATLTVRVASP